MDAGTAPRILLVARGMGIGALMIASGIAGAAASDAHAGSPVGSGGAFGSDFDGDGFADLAVGLPFEDFAGTDDGVVQVIYGSPGGLTAVGDDFLSQANAGIEENAESHDLFGASLAHGDFDGDGFTDLAVGVPQENVGGGTVASEGGVNVFYGSPSGLTRDRNQFLSQATSGIEGAMDGNEQFGTALASADFDGDGFADLAVSAVFDTAAAPSAGGVNVIYGSASGLTPSGDQLWNQASPGIFGTAEPGDAFGWSLAAGDFDDSGQADLAVGVPWESVTEDLDGGVHVIYGSPAGLDDPGDQFLTQDGDIIGTAEPGDKYGWVLAAADFGKSSHADLAVGVPFESLGSDGSEEGGVSVLYGSGLGLSFAGDDWWSQDEDGIQEQVAPGEHFGDALAAADFGDGPRADLAIGVPRETDRVRSDGIVQVLYGAGGGLTASGDDLWSQNGPLFGTSEVGDTFGSALAAGDFGNGPQADLAVGVPSEDFAEANDGGLNVIYGSSAGLSAAGDDWWSQDSTGIREEADADDRFGGVLNAGEQ